MPGVSGIAKAEVDRVSTAVDGSFQSLQVASWADEFHSGHILFEGFA